MPLSKYFKGKGESVMASMRKQYGPEKGKEIFYATANKMKGGMKEHLMQMKKKGKLKGKKAC